MTNIKTGQLKFSAGDCMEAIHAEMDAWQDQKKAQRLWAHDPTLWTNTDESEWMGWLDVAVSEEQELPRIEALAKELKDTSISDVVLLGMGGSSLCPAMMAKTFGQIKGCPHLHILDSTDPMQIRHLEQKIDLKKSLFIVSSKSGSTLEPNIFKDYFFAKLSAVCSKEEAAERFVAITDPNSSLEKLAKDQHFKAIFHGLPSIGGRYSALSNFGMVPSGLMGVNVREFLKHAKAMRAACAPDKAVNENPGILLGIILGVCAKRGKNKVTLIASPGIHALGAWLEQLIAESTGKEGKGLIPIDQEPLGAPNVYSADRVIAYIRLESEPDPKQDQAMDALEKAGHVVIRLCVSDKMHLGAELFRWEIATDVAGSILGINPFNQPDVEESKVLARQMTSEYEKTGHLTMPSSFFSENGISLFTNDKNLEDIKKQLNGTPPSLVEYLRAHLSRVKEGDYINFSAFIEMSQEHTALLQQGREAVRNKKKVATCLGFGPRFLHSTGQDYVGGPNTGVFLQITADHNEDLSIPGHPFTFGVVIIAQGQSYFEVLGKRSRRMLRVHLGNDVKGGLEKLNTVLTSALA